MIALTAREMDSYAEASAAHDDGVVIHGVVFRAPAASATALPGSSIYCQPDIDTSLSRGDAMQDVRRNAAGNAVKSVQHSIAGVASIVRSLPKRVELDEVDLPDLAALNDLHAVIDNAMDEAVRRMRQQVTQDGRPWASWAQIGRALDITRQAAQQRFGGTTPQ